MVGLSIQICSIWTWICLSTGKWWQQLGSFSWVFKLSQNFKVDLKLIIAALFLLAGCLQPLCCWSAIPSDIWSSWNIERGHVSIWAVRSKCSWRSWLYNNARICCARSSDYAVWWTKCQCNDNFTYANDSSTISYRLAFQFRISSLFHSNVKDMIKLADIWSCLYFS